MLSALVLVASCHSNTPTYSGRHGEKTQMDAEKEFTSSLKSSDSLAVIKKGDECMNLLREGKIDEALSMINVLAEDAVYPMPESYAEQLRSRFTMMPVCDYVLDYMAFSTQGNNDLCYRYEFAPKNEQGVAPTMKFTFNPVKVGGKWYLTLKDLGMSSKTMSKENQIHDKAPAPEEIRLSGKNVK